MATEQASVTAQFRKDDGFGLKDPIDEAIISDPENTFYGLSVYNELKLLKFLDLDKIYNLQMEEVKTITSKELANKLGINSKRAQMFLKANNPRDVKNKS